jgi:large subunit ribosomal protein L18
VAVESGRVVLSRPDDVAQNRALHGLSRALIANMCRGVSQGYAKGLEIYGTGYNCKVQGKQLHVNVGFMGRGVGRPAQFILDIPDGVQVANRSRIWARAFATRASRSVARPARSSPAAVDIDEGSTMKAVLIKEARASRRIRRVRKRVFGVADRPRLAVSRSHRNLYAQIIDDLAGRTLCAVSTQSKDVRGAAAYGGNVKAATEAGKRLGEQAKSLGIEAVCFDRRGCRYHGRIKALAEAARKAGLKF